MKKLLISLFIVLANTINFVSSANLTIKNVCQLANVDNDVACNQNKLSQFSFQEYQKLSNWIEHSKNKADYKQILEEIYYYYGLKLYLDNNNLELAVISQWEKITESKKLLNRIQPKLDDLYMKFGFISKIKGNDFIEEVRNYSQLDLDEKLEISPYSELLLHEKINDSWRDIIDYTSNSNIQTSGDDFLIIFANDLTNCYKNLITKHGKKLSLEERSSFFSVLSDIEFLMLNNFKQSQSYAKQCVELDESNKHCIDLIKANSKLLTLKSKTKFDAVVIDKVVNMNWKGEFTKMMKDEKGLNTFTKINERLNNYYKEDSKSMFSKIYKDMPYHELLAIYKSIAMDLSKGKSKSHVNGKKLKALMSVIKIKDVKSLQDLKTGFTEEHLKHLWHEKSPYVCLDIIAYLLHDEQFINDQYSIKIANIFNFLNNEKVLEKGTGELDDFSHSIIKSVK